MYTHPQSSTGPMRSLTIKDNYVGPVGNLCYFSISIMGEKSMRILCVYYEKCGSEETPP